MKTRGFKAMSSVAAAAALDRPTLWNLDHRTIERETRYLYAYSMKFLRDPDLAQDAVQEVLLAGLRFAERFDGRSSMRTWLTAILRRKIVDLLRSRTKEAVFFEETATVGGDEDEAVDTGGNEMLQTPLRESEKDTPPDAVEREQFWATLQGCLERLPAGDAEVFALREIWGESTDDIVRRMDISSSNSYTMLSRAKARLRVCFTNCWFRRARPFATDNKGGD